MPARCLGMSLLLLVAATGCPKDPPAPSSSWSTLSADLDRSVLSAWGNEAGDVYLAGGGLGVTGLDALALHHDGNTAAWRELPTTGHEETFWWVWGSPDGDAWFVGELGLVMRWDGTTFELMTSGTTATLFGVWGSGPDDVWIVGGLPNAGAVPENDVVLHYDGVAITRDTTAPVLGTALFKVWGSSADDIWVTGERGTVWHRTATGWRDRSVEVGARLSLFTVHGCSASEVYIVGGQTLYAYDGTSWSSPELPVAAGFNGVSCGGDWVLVVGNGGTKLRYSRTTEEWFDEQFDEPFDTDFHGALSIRGELWAVGGNFQFPAGVGQREGAVGLWTADATDRLIP